jgi:hypothetical protein
MTQMDIYYSLIRGIEVKKFVWNIDNKRNESFVPTVRIFVRELMIGLLKEDSEDMTDESRGERHLTSPFYGLPDGEKDNTINISAVFRNGNFGYFIGGQKYC